jgi:hypothetical protein
VLGVDVKLFKSQFLSRYFQINIGYTANVLRTVSMRHKGSVIMQSATVFYLFVIYLATLTQQHRIYSVELKICE